MHKFYIRMDGDIFGPYTAKGMVELNVMPDIMVTEDSIDTWQPAANFDFTQLAKQEILERIKPDILVITGHDAYYNKDGDYTNMSNYKNSDNFIQAVKVARSYEKDHDKLIVIAGACQSNYEELIKAGSNFASSPKRINIHALDPAIIAVSVSLSSKNKDIDLIKILGKTKYGTDGMGGIITNGTMYIGYPR